MEKTISAFEARRNLGKVLQRVESHGDSFIVERHGEPVAVVVPVELYKQWLRRRDDFFSWIEQKAAGAGVPEDEAEELVNEAIDAVRAERRERANKTA